MSGAGSISGVAWLRSVPDELDDAKEDAMDYRVGRQGRIVVARFEDGDDIIGGITELARKEAIRSAFFFLLGGMKEGRFVVGPRDESLPPVPVWRDMVESHETLGIGTIFWEGDLPRIHLHGAYAKGDTVRMGCLRERSRTFLILEVVILEIEGISAERKKDAATGLSLLHF